MLVSEEQAKTKWCPQARVVATNGRTATTANRGLSVGEVPNVGLCLGSGCMWWRWSHGTGIEPGTPKLGYCGAGGQP